MATVERREHSGGVSYRVRWRDDAGVQRSKTFARRRDADQWRTKVEHDLLSGSYVDPTAGRVTLRAYAEEWRASRVWAPTTAAKVETSFARHLYPVLGDRPIGRIRTSEVQAWVQGLGVGRDGRAALAPATVEVLATHLGQVMAAAVKDRVIPASPCSGVTVPRVDAAEVVPPTTAQVDALLAHVDEQWRPLVVVLAGLGLRISEALGLTVDRVDFLGRTVRIDQQVTAPGGPLRLTGRLKTQASYRTIPLPDSVGLALSATIRAHGTGEGGAIFHDGGRLIRRRRVNDALDKARELANAEARQAKTPSPLPGRVKPHDLRHYYASLLIHHGHSVKVVQRRMGHASATVTLDTYGHLWPESDEATRSAVDDELGRVASMWPDRAVEG